MTLEMAVAPIALAMANHPRLEDYDLSSLRYVMWGATPITPSVAETVSARTGVRWLPAYGTSEVPVITANPVDDPDRWRLDSAGLPVGGVTLRVVDLETGEVLASGGVGEVQVKSDSAMASYLPDEATAAAFADGWYRTGDVGWLEPEGWVHLTDRSKEMIKVSGFQVAPAEIEAVLHGHPAVVDCAVFGVPDERAGEVPGRRRPARGRLRCHGGGSATARRRRAGHLQAAAPRRPRRRHPADAVGQGAAPDIAGRVGPCLRRRTAQLMDVRLSPSRWRCAMPRRRWSIAWGCTASPSSTIVSVPPSSTPRWPPPAGASCARRPTTGRPGPRPSKSRSLPRSSDAASPMPPSSVRPWPPSSADEPVRRLPEELKRWRYGPTSGAGHGRGRPRAPGCPGARRRHPRSRVRGASAAPTAGPSARSRLGRPWRHGAAASTSPAPSRPSTHRGPSPRLTGRPIRSAATTWPPG